MRPDDELAPWAAYLDIHEGDPGHGMALSMALRDESLELSAGRASRVSDLAIHRLWLARVESRPDPGARAAAEEVLDSGHPISPYRRAMLHYALGVDILVRTPLRRLTDLEPASEHLNHCRALARSLGIVPFVARCEAMLALLEVPRGNLAVAEELCLSALSTEDPSAGHAPGFWQIRALVVLQWTRHYQGGTIDVEVLDACSEHPLIWSEPIIASLLAAVRALAARESRDLTEAWRALGRAQVDRRIAGIGIWCLPMLLVDGYLSVTRDDPRQTERVIEQLELLPAPAEAALVRAVQLSHHGRVRDALATVARVTSGELATLSFTYPLAMTLEASLYEELGLTREADRSTARALGAAEPINAVRLFSKHGPDHQRTLVHRAAAAAPRNRWIARVAAYVDGFVDAAPEHGFETTVRTDQDQPPVPSPAPGVLGSPLTARELDVLRRINEGASHAQISAALYVTPNTVKSHMRSIRRKLGVHRTSEATAFARREGWI